MNVTKYILHCSRCKPSRWVEVSADKVTVTVDLRTDEYVFEADCPECGYPIHNRRRAF